MTRVQITTTLLDCCSGGIDPLIHPISCLIETMMRFLQKLFSGKGTEPAEKASAPQTDAELAGELQQKVMGYLVNSMAGNLMVCMCVCNPMLMAR